MAIFSPWSVVVVRFPFIDRRQITRRPAVVLSPERFQTDHQCAVLGMITDARNPRWPSDVTLRDLAATGLCLSSVFRCKLLTLKTQLILSQIGMLSPRDKVAVLRALHRAMASR
ncbi:MAG: type II toxin-antitoxin system PemK/MazF family toxin [Candidatus Binatia bacterium]